MNMRRKADLIGVDPKREAEGSTPNPFANNWSLPNRQRYMYM